MKQYRDRRPPSFWRNQPARFLRYEPLLACSSASTPSTSFDRVVGVSASLSAAAAVRPRGSGRLLQILRPGDRVCSGADQLPVPACSFDDGAALGGLSFFVTGSPSTNAPSGTTIRSLPTCRSASART